ncbi:MAG TPA: hypothetical protein VGF79_01040 [Bacteroidia bacterium]
MKIEIATTKTIEMPDYFIIGDWVFKSNKTNFTGVKKSAPLIQFMDLDGFSDKEIESHQPTSESYFKIMFCNAVSELAGFKICNENSEHPNIKLDELHLSDVQK